MKSKRISAQELHKLIGAGALEKDAIILDVRTSAEFAENHISGSKNIELNNFNGNEDFVKSRKRIFVVCKGGVRSEKACAKIPSDLSQKAEVLEGGMDAWISSGYDVIRIKNSGLPVIQQTQLAIGIIVFVTSLLSLVVSKLFSIITLVVGCGLIFAGLTGVCMLLRVISKMPWNK